MSTFGETLNEVKFPILTIASVVGFAYIINLAGMSTTLGLVLAKTGSHLFPFFSPFLGWIGVFVTGWDTSVR
jgi:lactate permease